MSGRSKFQYIKWPLNWLGFFLGLLPSFLHNWLWQLTDLFPDILGYGIRYALAKGKAAKLGDNVLFGRNTTVKHWNNFWVGQNVSVHENCFIDALGGVRIGNQVSIAHNCSLVSFDHDFSNVEKQVAIKYSPLLCSPIVIGDDVWVAAGVRVLRGTTVASRTVIAANAVIRGEYGGNAIYGGVPARKLKAI